MPRIQGTKGVLENHLHLPAQRPERGLRERKDVPAAIEHLAPGGGDEFEERFSDGALSAAAFAHVDMQAKYDARNPAALKQLVAQKAKVLPFPKDVMDLAYKESMALYAEISAKNPNWKKVYDDYSDFRKEQNLWFRFTEARFDTFMQAQKL